MTSYLVQRSSSRDGSYKTIARLETGKSYTDGTVKGANRYYYQVAAKTKSSGIIYSKPCSFQCPSKSGTVFDLIHKSDVGQKPK